MKQYLQLLRDIEERGTQKPAARENMPGTLSLFGYQFRHNLADGFPLLTTKKMYWKGVVAELLWFLRGDTNVKYLIDHGVNIWNEDAYNYYIKVCNGLSKPEEERYTFDEFVNHIKLGNIHITGMGEYTLGDCGFQYGKVWRDWEGRGGQGFVLDTAMIPDDFDVKKYMEEMRMGKMTMLPVDSSFNVEEITKHVDQIRNVIHSLRNSPTSRRHIVTAIDPAHDDNLALYWCHAMFQFNCRPVPRIVREKMAGAMFQQMPTHEELDDFGVPRYYLDCQLYQRSADVFLGVPFNIASYALLTEILAKMCNMIPGEFVHTFGDVHIYDNHWDAVNEQLSRTEGPLPKLSIDPNVVTKDCTVEDFMNFSIDDFDLIGYDPQPSIKAELSTGMKK